MSKRLFAGVFGLALALALVPVHVLRAQEAADPIEAAIEEHEASEHKWDVTWGDGHKMESRDKKFKLKFGGRIQADYSFVSADDQVEGLPIFGNVGDDGFEFRRARLFFEGEIYNKIIFKAQYDFSGGETAVKDLFIGLKLGPGDLLFGHTKEPFSLETLTSSKYIAFMERSMPTEAFSPERNSGVNFAGGGDMFSYGAGVFYDSDDFGESIDGSRINITGRLAFRPIFLDKGAKMVHLGLGLTSKDTGDLGLLRFRARPENHLSGRLVDTGNFAADGAFIYNLEAAAVFKRLWVASEWFDVSTDSPEFGDPSFSGYYLQAGFFLTDDYRRYKGSAFDRQKPKKPWDGSGGHGAWEVLGRVSSIDLADRGINGGEETNWTLGLNWYPNNATRLMINYVNADVKQTVGADTTRLGADADFFMVRWQVDF